MISVGLCDSRDWCWRLHRNSGCLSENLSWSKIYGGLSTIFLKQLFSVSLMAERMFSCSACQSSQTAAFLPLCALLARSKKGLCLWVKVPLSSECHHVKSSRHRPVSGILHKHCNNKKSEFQVLLGSWIVWGGIGKQEDGQTLLGS